MFIEQMQKERNGFIDQLLTANRKVGELETRLLQLERPTEKQPRSCSSVQFHWHHAYYGWRVEFAIVRADTRTRLIVF